MELGQRGEEIFLISSAPLFNNIKKGISWSVSKTRGSVGHTRAVSGPHQSTTHYRRLVALDNLLCKLNFNRPAAATAARPSTSEAVGSAALVDRRPGPPNDLGRATPSLLDAAGRPGDLCSESGRLKGLLL
jgi:hypothetical protein